MKNYTKTNVGNDSGTELHEKLALTGAEISINRLARGMCGCSLFSFSQAERRNLRRAFRQRKSYN